MGKFLLGIIIGGLGLFVYQRAHQSDPAHSADPVSAYAESPESASPPAVENPAVENPAVENDEPRFSCDGRVHCSEMRSCDEAEFFLAHCPGVKMDGDRDGLPCEDMCRH